MTCEARCEMCVCTCVGREVGVSYVTTLFVPNCWAGENEVIELDCELAA